ncbi:hypothetical protein Syun_028021 [Stephania yunnanensis]|uniref:Uncharacterized protein n=1 Tax=Stephania yunnanensis TaxID=152371 RepID=A0AAP0EJ35_9MAGN
MVANSWYEVRECEKGKNQLREEIKKNRVRKRLCWGETVVFGLEICLRGKDTGGAGVTNSEMFQGDMEQIGVPIIKTPGTRELVVGVGIRYKVCEASKQCLVCNQTSCCVRFSSSLQLPPTDTKLQLCGASISPGTNSMSHATYELSKTSGVPSADISTNSYPRYRATRKGRASIKISNYTSPQRYFLITIDNHVTNWIKGANDDYTTIQDKQGACGGGGGGKTLGPFKSNSPISKSTNL